MGGTSAKPKAYIIGTMSESQVRNPLKQAERDGNPVVPGTKNTFPNHRGGGKGAKGAGWAWGWGFRGSARALTVYGMMLVWAFVIARTSKDTFGAVLAIGLMGTLLWPAAINVAMVLGLAPVIGVPLPLFSYGGSALISASLTIGLLLNI